MQIFLRNGRLAADERCELFGKYLIDNNATVRDAAAHFGISKSTVHKDVRERLKKRNPSLFDAVSEVLSRNKSERHIRGGNATRLRYKKLRDKEIFNKNA